MSEAKVVFLEGPLGVTLRPNLKDDTSRLTRWINDPVVRRFIKNPFPTTDLEEDEWRADIGKRKPNDIILAIEVGGIHIGQTALHRIHWRDRVATTGTVIGETEYWGRGYGTIAKMLLLDYAFNTLNLRKICSQVLAFNARSLAVQKKCGYKEEGVFREHIFRNGQYWDLVQLAVFREDFSLLWQEFQKKYNLPAE